MRCAVISPARASLGAGGRALDSLTTPSGRFRPRQCAACPPDCGGRRSASRSDPGARQRPRDAGLAGRATPQHRSQHDRGRAVQPVTELFRPIPHTVGVPVGCCAPYPPPAFEWLKKVRCGQASHRPGRTGEGCQSHPIERMRTVDQAAVDEPRHRWRSRPAKSCIAQPFAYASAVPGLFYVIATANEGRRRERPQFPAIAAVEGEAYPKAAGCSRC